MGLRNVRGETLQRVIAILRSVAFLVQGYNQAMMNAFTTLPSFLHTVPEIDTTHTTGAQKSHNAIYKVGLVIAIFELSSAVGALCCLGTGDRLGRPTTMLLAGSISIIGVIIQATTYSLAQILAGRIITGIGIGLYTGTIPMYVSETAGAQRRGQLVLVEGVFSLSGLAVAAWVNFGMYYTSGSLSWRFTISLQLVLLLILVALTPFLPESPRWLVKKEKMDEATSIMARLMDRSVDDPEVAKEIAVIHAAMTRATDHGNKYSTNPFALNQNRHLYRSFLAITATMFLQLTGISAIAFYSVSIFEETLGYSGASARALSASLQVTLALGGLTAVFCVDRFGRRPLMLFSLSSMVVCQAAVAGLTSDQGNVPASRAAVFFYILANYTLAVGMFMMPFMYGAEVAPLGIRHKITAMGAVSCWLFNFMVAEVTPTAFANTKWRYNIVYAAISVVSCVMVFLFFPETRGRSLEEIDGIFLQSKSIFDPVRVAKKLPVGIDLLETIQGEKGETNNPQVA